MLPARGERCLITGQTGSGKTKLAQLMCGFRPFVVVLDSKGKIDWPGYALVRTFRELQALRVPRIIYRPTYAESADELIVDAFFEWIYRRGFTTLYVDELDAVTDGVNTFPHHYGACVKRGRELGVEVWASTQRPTRIPQIALSESEHVYVFPLKLPQDRQRMADVAGVDPELIEQLDKTQFLWAPQTGDAQGPFRLDLDAAPSWVIAPPAPPVAAGAPLP